MTGRRWFYRYYGGSYVPGSWQGWASMLGFALALVVGAIVIFPWLGQGAVGAIAYGAWLVACAAGLGVIVVRTADPEPRLWGRGKLNG